MTIVNELQENEIQNYIILIKYNLDSITCLLELKKKHEESYGSSAHG